MTSTTTGNSPGGHIPNVDDRHLGGDDDEEDREPAPDLHQRLLHGAGIETVVEERRHANGRGQNGGHRCEVGSG